MHFQIILSNLKSNYLLDFERGVPHLKLVIAMGCVFCKCSPLKGGDSVLLWQTRHSAAEGDGKWTSEREGCGLSRGLGAGKGAGTWLGNELCLWPGHGF